MNRNDPRLRPIPGFPDYYVEEVPGNIWSFMLYKDGRILKPIVITRNRVTGKPGSVSVNLYVNGKLHVRIISRLIMNVIDPKVTVDHKDRNIWNNRKDNLRIATRQQQLYNTASYSKTGFKGVYNNGFSFIVRIRLDGKLSSFGTYENIYEAAACYNVEVSEIHGDFAVYNKVDGRVLTL